MIYEQIKANYLNNSFVTRKEVTKGGQNYTVLYNGLANWLNIYSVDSNNWMLIETIYSENYLDDNNQWQLDRASIDLAIDAGYSVVN